MVAVLCMCLLSEFARQLLISSTQGPQTEGGSDSLGMREATSCQKWREAFMSMHKSRLLST